MTFRGSLSVAPMLVLFAACNSGQHPAPEPAAPVEPAPAQTASSAAALPPGASVIPAEVVEAPPLDAGPADAGAGGATAEAGPPSEPALRGPDGGVLPQTRATPAVDSALFRHHVDLLFEAIQKDDPSIGMPFFFPVLAYRQVKAIQKPERDWKYRLVAAYERTVHRYHRRLGQHPEKARLLGLDVPMKRARWMKPGSEGNKLGYYRVLDSLLRYRTADGKERSFGVTSLISWRGEWYLVHLHGFK
jgi:hypothetical protein